MTGSNPFARWRLVIRVSYDEGQTFPVEHVLLEEFASYSDLTILKDGTVGILWERSWQSANEFVTFTRLNLAFLESPSP